MNPQLVIVGVVLVGGVLGMIARGRATRAAFAKTQKILTDKGVEASTADQIANLICRWSRPQQIEYINKSLEHFRWYNSLTPLEQHQFRVERELVAIREAAQTPQYFWFVWWS